jgi:hypothetical protein
MEQERIIEQLDRTVASGRITPEGQPVCAPLRGRRSSTP